MNIEFDGRSLELACFTCGTSIESGNGMSPIRQPVFLQSR